MESRVSGWGFRGELQQKMGRSGLTLPGFGHLRETASRALFLRDPEMSGKTNESI
jgi:hypothetical protein